MARVCDVCEKGKVFGNHISHSVRHNKRTWLPNLRRVKVILNGTTKRINVCTRCLRSGKVERAI